MACLSAVHPSVRRPSVHRPAAVPFSICEHPPPGPAEGNTTVVPHTFGNGVVLLRYERA